MLDCFDQYGVSDEGSRVVDQIRQYILTLICMAIICGSVPKFFGDNGAQKKLLSFVAGMVMTIVAVSPFLGKNLQSYLWIREEFSLEAQDTIAIGQEQADSMLSDIIIKRIQSYILDKAASMGADLTAEVILDDSKPCVPSCVILSGAASPYVKRQLTETLGQQLAISEDNVVWN